MCWRISVVTWTTLSGDKPLCLPTTLFPWCCYFVIFDFYGLLFFRTKAQKKKKKKLPRKEKYFFVLKYWVLEYFIFKSRKLVRYHSEQMDFLSGQNPLALVADSSLHTNGSNANRVQLCFPNSFLFSAS